MISRQSLRFMRFPGRAGEPESFTALPGGATQHVARSLLSPLRGFAEFESPQSPGLRPGLLTTVPPGLNECNFKTCESGLVCIFSKYVPAPILF